VDITDQILGILAHRTTKVLLLEEESSSCEFEHFNFVIINLGLFDSEKIYVL